MVELTVWTERFLQALETAFGPQVWFVGLQGSYSRGEATAQSDLDMVVILDTLSASDIRRYREMLDTLPNREQICGFLSGKEELLRWEPSDLFQFCHDTTPIKGSLDDVLSLLDKTAVRRAIRIGACNLYHGCVHNMLHERSDEILKGLYKAASFTVQAICYAQTNTYVRRQTDLAKAVGAEERAIVETFLYLKEGGAVRFEEMSERLFAWAQKQITAL